MGDEATLVKRWVNKENPESSKFILRVQDGSMPLGGEPLSLENQELILEYLRGFKG